MEARDLIVAARRGAGLTQAELAARLVRQQSTISAWESGTQEPAFAAVIAAIDACGQHLGVGLYKADDSYDALIAEQLRLEPDARIRKLTLLQVDLPQLLADLVVAGAQFVLIGRVAAAAHGWPISLDDPAALLEVVPADPERFAEVLAGCGYTRLDDRRWVLDGVILIVHERPARTAGYRDLARGSDVFDLLGVGVPVASLIDLIRVLEGDGFSNLRPFGAALWATLAIVRQRQARADRDAADAVTA
jgi:transcriptional regulator with XRE-family HTH domain